MDETTADPKPQAQDEHEHEHDHEHDHDHDHDHEERGEQSVTVEEIGPARKRLTIQIPAERIAEKVEDNYKRLRDDAAVPGFRRGRVPHRLLEKRFGKAVRDDVKAQILSECYTQAVEDEKLQVLGDPDIQDVEKIELPDDGALTFQVEVEVAPDVKLPKLAGLEVRKTRLTVSDEEVEKQLDQYRNRYGKLTTVADGAIEAGDYLRADGRILAGENAGDDAEELVHNAETAILVHGEEVDFRGHVLGIVITDLGRQLIGKRAGETVSLNATGPSGYENEKVRDQPVTIRIRIDRIERVEPADDDALQQAAGIESIDEMREQLRKNLESVNERRQSAEMHEQVKTQLLDKVEMTLPEGITARQSERNIRRARYELAYRGMSESEIEDALAEHRRGSTEQAQRQLKEFFILDKAAKELEADVTPDELNMRVAMMAFQQGRRPEKVRQEMQRSGELENLYLFMREQKTLDKILEKAKVTEVDPEPEQKTAAKGESAKGKDTKAKDAKEKAADEEKDRT